MKCPQCGDEVVNGACRFCGYRPTAADREALDRWAAQKAALENGAAPPPERRERTQRQKPARQKPAAASRQALPVAKRAAAPRHPAGKAHARQQAPPAPRTPSGRAPKAGRRARDGPGFFGKLVPRLVVLIWAALLAYLIVTEIAPNVVP